MDNAIQKVTGPIFLVTTYLLVLGLFSAHAAQPITRIAILPISTEQDGAANIDENLIYSKQMIRFINSRLINSDFEVLNLFAYKIDKSELKQMMYMAGINPAKVSNELCYRYGLDAVIMVKLDITVTEFLDGYWKAMARAYIDGYDNTQKSLGIMDDKNMMITKRDPDSAVRVAEKELGSMMARIISTRLSQGVNRGVTKGFKTNQSSMTLRLEGANNEELVGVFGKVINTVKGIESAKILNQQIVPKQPKKCFVTWQVQVDSSKTDTFRLKTNITKMINDILDAGGYIKINGIHYRYSPSQVKMLQGFRSSKLTPTFIMFVIDPDRARARDLSDHHDPENAKQSENPSFE